MFLDFYIDFLAYIINSEFWDYFFVPAFSFSVIIIFSQMLVNVWRWNNV